MTNPLRLLLLLLMGGSLLAARWADGLGQRLVAATTTAAQLPQPRPVAQARPFWVPVGGWQGWARPVSQPVRPGQGPAVRAL